MTEIKIEARQGRIKSTAVVVGDSRPPIKLEDITIKFTDGRDITAFTDGSVLLEKTDSATMCYYSSVTHDRGWRADWQATLFLMVSGTAVEQHDMGIFHAYCGSTPQQASFGINPDHFGTIDDLWISFHLVSPPAPC